MALCAADLHLSNNISAHTRTVSNSSQEAPDHADFEPFDPRGALNRRRAPSSSSINSGSGESSPYRSLASSTSSIAIPGTKQHKLRALSPLNHPGEAAKSSSEDASTISPTLRSAYTARSYDELLDNRRREMSASVCLIFCAILCTFDTLRTDGQ